ncbi:MAG: trehalase family glycosidase [Terriglobia bacterium]
MMFKHFRYPVVFLICVASLAGQHHALANPQSPSGILSYISSAWTTLTRSMSECKMLADPKDPANAVLYFPADYPAPPALKQSLAGCPVRLEHLPSVIHRLGEINEHEINPHGLLYLPHPYVVPGGMFNEMYGWDSYFILRGLLQAGKIDLSRGIVENFFFEIDHYGAILNANRGYTLSRSQPPFLTAMVRAVYDAEKTRGQDDRAWLRLGYPYGAREYDFWTHAPNIAGPTGLSRYKALGSGPAPELGAPSDDYYRGVVTYFLTHPQEAAPYLARSGPAKSTMRTGPTTSTGGLPSQLGSLFPLLVCNPVAAGQNPLKPEACGAAGGAGLSAAFYEGDRSLRESGFDITFKFGPFGAGTPDYAPVGLNSLLYNEAQNLAWMSAELGREDQAAAWRKRASERRAAMNRYLWNPRRGLYFDYNFKTGKQSGYVYATTFYPLWIGAASPAQAAAVEKNLKLLEEPGGIVMSRKQTGAQWDYPYGWAPIQLIADEGLRRYGDNADANRVSLDFLSMVAANFRRDHTIREKYNVVTRSSELTIQVGYPQNVIGFGWTNGVFTTLLSELPLALREKAGE